MASASEVRNNGFQNIGDLLEKNQPYEEFDATRFGESIISDDGNDVIKRIQGSLIGLAVGDAIGAPVEFRPNSYLTEHRVDDMQSGGTWGLQAGQWTDDTSMTLCLAASLISKKGFDPYDQFVKYKRWFLNGYMSSTGKCFDIGKSTRESIKEFERKETEYTGLLAKQYKTDEGSISREMIGNYFNENHRIELGKSDAAGNGSLMRLAPIPAFFFSSQKETLEYAALGTKLTHGDKRAIDACRFYAGLIWHALSGKPKQEILHETFYDKVLGLELHPEVLAIAKGSYKGKKKGYEDGIRGAGFVLNSLEAALWALYNDENSFEKGVLLAVNLGDDTDTTAAIYGQLAGALYRFDGIPQKWVTKLFAHKFIMALGKALYIKGKEWYEKTNVSDASSANNARTLSHKPTRSPDNRGPNILNQ